MQTLTAPPRDAFTAAQVTALLTAADLVVDFGCEQLSPALVVVADISADVRGGAVHYNSKQAVLFTVELTLSRELAWGFDRVRPYLVLSSPSAGVAGARFNLGVYLLTTPDQPLAETPATYTVSGYDQLHLLQAFIGDSYSVAAGANVLAAVMSALTSAGVTAPILLDSSAAAAVFPAGGRTWPMLPPSGADVPANVAQGSASFTWMDVVNDLLKSVGYQSVWCDWDGAFRSGPFVAPSGRAAEWTFPVGDLEVGVVAEDRSVTADVWGVANRWTFYQNGLTAAPVAGTSLYVRNNTNVGLSSQASLGRVVPAQPQGLDAVDFASLKTQGDAIADAAMRVTETVRAKLSPFPLLWHSDVACYVDAALGDQRSVQGVAWDQPLDGTDVTITWETIT